MKSLFRLLASLLLGFSAMAFAGSYQTVRVTTSASGASEDKAIIKALGQAIQQANGSTVSVHTHVRDTDQSVVVDWMGNQSIIPGQEINSGYTSTQAGGLIKSYKVTNSQYLKEAQAWKVTISAEVAKYANIGADRSGLLQMAILPFRTTAASYSAINDTVSADTVARKLNELMTNAVVQSGKFRVLDRSFWAESDIEEQIVLERSYGNQESIKLGQKLGADYMVVGTIENFDINRTLEKLYGSSTAVFETVFAIQVRVIEIATSDIIWSQHFTQSLDKRQLNQKLQELRNSNPQKSEELLAAELQNHIYQTVSNQLSHAIVQQLTGSSATGINIENSQPKATSQQARPLTPGSSEQPLEWQ